MSDYDEQHRGQASDYDRYLAGMDASMRQKVALTAAHLLCEGDVADMGMGSGAGSHALAALYPELRVTGVDVNQAMVQRANERYGRENLSFVVGDVAQPCFESGTQEAILNSSVLHHVTSFNGYDRGAAERALQTQVEALSVGGVLIVRDFVDPGPGEVLLDLPVEDAETVSLLLRFSKEFKILAPDEGRGFPCEEQAGPPGWRRFRMAKTHAAEFVLRKDYRADWDLEVQEEYTYATQAEFESMFARLGLRVLASRPIHNPWIVSNRFVGRFIWRDLHEKQLDWPATNYVIVGQKVALDRGLSLGPGPVVSPTGYLEMTHWRRDDGVIYDLVRRPNTTIDVVPWFEQDGVVRVLARRSYPRPIPACHPRTMDGSTPATYITEPLNVQQGDKPLAQTVEEMLAEFESMSSDQIRGFGAGSTVYPSPGGVQEQIRSVFVEVEAVNVDVALGLQTGFSTSGDLRAIEARQLLRAAQVGALPDARLELHTYELLARLGRSPGAWIGAEIGLEEGEPLSSLSPEKLISGPQRRRFQRVEPSGDFLALEARQFVEKDAKGQVLSQRSLEYVRPRSRSLDTLVLLPLRRHRGVVYVGMADEDFPAAQCFVGHSDLVVAPAWRLPQELKGQRASLEWAMGRLRDEYGVVVSQHWVLGGWYHPSPGVTPEIVHPYAVEACSQGSLNWSPLDALLAQRHRLCDGHLRIALWRAAHALGLGVLA